MALLPPIHDRPADRPETWAEYLSRRAMVALHRQLLDEVAACGVTWRADSVRRFLADPGKTDLFFTDAGVLQVENLNIDLAPELKELIGQAR